MGVTIHRDTSGIHVMQGTMQIASDDMDCYARAAHFAIDAADLDGKTVAWIGGGLCIGPKVFAIADCLQVIFEIEPALAEFVPKGASFIAGDWANTFTGMYDVIVWDIPGEPPRSILATYLNPGGKILP